MLKKSFVEELFKAFYIERWNDKIRQVELIEMDKHAHKMVIAWCIAKYEEMQGNKVNWVNIIRGGMFDLLFRIELSDIKSPLFREIKQNKQLFLDLSNWVYHELEAKIGSKRIKSELFEYFNNYHFFDKMSWDILNAAHIYSSYWEFKILKRADPFEYQIERIETALIADLESFNHLIGIKKLLNEDTIIKFIDLCGQMRFQKRWGQTMRLPKTSVLGHSLFVACLSFFLSYELDACEKRLYNNFFGGLFHDLPEAVTRDIISPVKKSVKGMPEAIKVIEELWADREIYPLVDEEWHAELKFFTRDEFTSKIIDTDGIKHLDSNTISKEYNKDCFSPYDGELVKAVDELAAFLECWHSNKLGMKSEELIFSMFDIQRRYRDKTVAGIPFKELYVDF